jgi:hypothetical protein
MTTTSADFANTPHIEKHGYNEIEGWKFNGVIELKFETRATKLSGYSFVSKFVGFSKYGLTAQ